MLFIEDGKFMFVAADKYFGLEDKKHLGREGQKCRFGFCWWYWLPRLKIRLKSKYKVVEISWFRFSLSYEGM